MRRDAAKEDCLRTLGISLLRIPSGLVLEDPEDFVGKVQEAIGGGHRTTPHPPAGRSGLCALSVQNPLAGEGLSRSG
jgi:hypothetical protein